MTNKNLSVRPIVHLPGKCCIGARDLIKFNDCFLTMAHWSINYKMRVSHRRIWVRGWSSRIAKLPASRCWKCRSFHFVPDAIILLKPVDFEKNARCVQPTEMLVRLMAKRSMSAWRYLRPMWMAAMEPLAVRNRFILIERSFASTNPVGSRSKPVRCAGQNSANSKRSFMVCALSICDHDWAAWTSSTMMANECWTVKWIMEGHSPLSLDTVYVNCWNCRFKGFNLTSMLIVIHGVSLLRFWFVDTLRLVARYFRYFLGAVHLTLKDNKNQRSNYTIHRQFA